MGRFPGGDLEYWSSAGSGPLEEMKVTRINKIILLLSKSKVSSTTSAN